MALIRIQVEQAGVGGAIRYIDPTEALGRLTEAQREAATEACDALAAACGRSQQWAAEFLLSVLRWADEDGYRREAGRRGVLAL